MAATQKESACLLNKRIGTSRFTIGPYVTGGSFGALHIGYDKDGNKYAVKLEKQTIAIRQLCLEYGFYKLLSKVKFIPKTFFFGPCEGWDALVMELLGPSLREMSEKVGRRFSITCTSNLMIQLLAIYEYTHDHGLLYRDTKPDNFLFGRPDTDKWASVNLIDLGFCKKYVDDETNRHIPYREGKSITGTARFISVNNHQGREVSRRDDLLALCYMIVFLHRGQLPWQGIPNPNTPEWYTQVGLVKMRTTAAALFANMPAEFEVIMESIQELGFEERPKYRYYMGLLRNCLIRMGAPFEDQMYDWDRSHNPIPPEMRT